MSITQKYYTKIEHNLNEYHFYNLINQLLFSRKRTQLNFYLFCLVFNVYTFGNFFILSLPNGKSNLFFYNELKHLQIIKPFRKVHLFGATQLYFPDSTRMNLVTLPVMGCEISPYLVKCIKNWHVKRDFDHLKKRICKFTGNLNDLLSQPVCKREITDLGQAYLTPTYINAIQHGLHRIWKHRHLSTHYYISHLPASVIENYIIRPLHDYIDNDVSPLRLDTLFDRLLSSGIHKPCFNYKQAYDDRFDFTTNQHVNNLFVYNRDEVQDLITRQWNDGHEIMINS